MEFTEEFIQETGLTAEQAEKVIGFANNHISELESSWSAKANQNAEKILEGAAKSVQELTGIERAKGQKIADYFKVSGETFIKSQKSLIEQKEAELNDKIKKAGHNETLIQELEQAKQNLNKLKEKEAIFSEWEQNDYKGKYETASKELDSLRLDVSFEKVKPVFPESVNKYEADYKWNQFKNTVLEKNNIKLVDGVPIAIDKENEYKTAKLEDLVKKDAELSSILSGQNKGFGGKPKSVAIEGIPFEVPENATPKQRTEAIKEYLASQGISTTNPEYPKKFAELNQKILLSPKTAK
jgi:hypothetical protein